MAVSQIQASFQNDGNFAQLDIQDVRQNGPVMRIETFRCSQPLGEFGITAAGSPVTAICGKDHLTPHSNRTFRHVFSVGAPSAPLGKLEIRETFDEDGTLEVRTRDIDAGSGSYGSVLIARATPLLRGVELSYEFRKPIVLRPVPIISPVKTPIADRTFGLKELSEAVSSLGELQRPGKFRGTFSVDRDNASPRAGLQSFAHEAQALNSTWTDNVKVYERMGDFRDKCIHDGTNLTGPQAALASEYMLIRAYRMSLITIGPIFDVEMSNGADRINTAEPLAWDTKPGVYSAFLAAYALNIGLYQLGLDKVHSDYGDVPMRLKPGSRLETGIQPIVDATNLNRMLAFLAAVFYVPAAAKLISDVEPAIMGFHVAGAALPFIEQVAA